MTLLLSACTSVLSDVLGGTSGANVLMYDKHEIIRSSASLNPYLAAICAHWSKPNTTREKTASSVADMKTYESVAIIGFHVAANISAS
jgi:hypothetical protein